MRRLLLSLAAFAALSTPAFATGGFSCAVKDANVTFEAEAGFSYSLGGILNFRGALALPADLAQKGLSAVTLDPSSLTHHWLHDGELRLLVHAESGDNQPFAALDFVMMTTVDEEGLNFEGTYTLKVEGADLEEPVRRSIAGLGDGIERGSPLLDLGQRDLGQRHLVEVREDPRPQQQPVVPLSRGSKPALVQEAVGERADGVTGRGGLALRLRHLSRGWRSPLLAVDQEPLGDEPRLGIHLGRQGP